MLRAAAVDTLDSLLAWAWARHHNVLSWYVRPLCLIPFCYFAFKRKPWGMVASIVALATSMFWFPAPEVVDPAVEKFLAMERDYLLGEWRAWKVLLTLTVPLFFAALGAALWRRSWVAGLAVINLAALGKIAWSIGFGDGAGAAVVAPAVLGMVVVSGAVLAWSRRGAR